MPFWNAERYLPLFLMPVLSQIVVSSDDGPWNAADPRVAEVDAVHASRVLRAALMAQQAHDFQLCSG